ncbi:helix-turn-helix domain-containing protein [Kineobactrum salinum]|uniref:Helix-turn-helix domain-containing protein n=1 Tax=Kineobactrum salinum TaxID=2708301 RepID=A0A6C0U485_9GAMM|nr:helix-turn-helix domain-containing protein [Kineobactrum salinum]QIB66942.1 helix-turn-helix domain-containing protein [Kineobactrum salinum]
MGSKEIFSDQPGHVAPGALLRAAREARGLSRAEAAARLKWLPDYVRRVEHDDYQTLRQPAFARGYVRAYGRMLGLDETGLLAAFDATQPAIAAPEPVPRRSRPPQLQRTGAGIVLGLAVLALLTLGLWWAQTGQAAAAPVFGG